jgi:hypothetical protein
MIAKYIFHLALKFTNMPNNIFHSKARQNIPKVGFLVLMYLKYLIQNQMPNH